MNMYWQSEISASFTRKKAKILADLSVPEHDYLDRSPKGSVDEGVRDLINEINANEGLVTTSSCAGRINVFLEGDKGYGERDGVADGDDVSPRTALGGKGGGTFLFTSHEPLNPASIPASSLTETFKLKLVPSEELGSTHHFNPRNRVIRFSFEPMILHVMAASLKHAQPLLSAAINAGFRESGLQSLRNLDDPGACPVVAVRTAGLALESIIGHAGLNDALEVEHQHTEGSELYANEYEALVTEDYLGILVSIANERFEANKEKIARFRTCLREAVALQLKKTREAEDWEDAESRRQRKREEGLRVSRDKKALRNGEVADTVMTEASDEEDLLHRPFLSGGSSSNDSGVSDFGGFDQHYDRAAMFTSTAPERDR
jgi:tRNA wybutosine-synthesizing protein 3